jgi:tetratricopeptide (TPR) repeat protein
MKPNPRSLAITLSAALTAVCGAQVYTPPPTQAPPPERPTDTAPAAPRNDSSPGLFGQEIPMLDPAADAVTVGGVRIPLGDNRLMRARFEKYLSQPPEVDEAAVEYRKNISQILDAVSPFRSGGPDLYSGFRLLPSAASYPGDANLCKTLAEAVYMAMLAKSDVTGLRRLNDSIENEKQKLIAEGDWRLRHEREDNLGDRQPTGGGQGGNGRPNNRQNADGQGAASLRHFETLRRLAEIEALKKTNIARTEAQTLQTKAQYQVSMVQWFVQRRFEHVVMAARFYNQIWRDGDSTLQVDKNSDVSRLFSESVGVSPTVTSLDSLANEAIREVEKYVEAFELLLERDELHSASERLMEAFALGEYLNPVTTLPIEKKRRVTEYIRDLHELYGAVQARDYTRGKELVARLKAAARDFPASKVDSVIAGSTLASDLAIEEAKAHLIARDSERASAKIREAAEMWPTNPKLDEFRNLVASSSIVVIARNDFDRLLSERNYREIARRQYEFAPVIRGDAGREDALRQIVTNLTKIEAALGKAGEFSKMGQNYAAWEQLAELRTEFPDDPNLGRELELLAPKVADFTMALDRARQFENRTPKQTGSAINWYLRARELHPQSKFAEEAINRLIGEIIPQ